jgi:flagellar biosynthesis activator protein FlaF
MQNAAGVYSAVANRIANARELEAKLLLKAAAQMQLIHDAWDSNKSDLDHVLLNNRKLWTIFLTSVTSDDNPLPPDVRQNVANLGLFVIKQTLTIATNPHRDRLVPLININRELAAGLGCKT